MVIRIDPLPDERLVGRRFLSDERILVAHPSFPKPEVPSLAAGDRPVAAIVLSTSTTPLTWRVRSAQGDETAFAAKPVLRLSSLLMVREAALLPKLLVEEDVAAGRLAYWGTQAGPAVEIWALQSSRRLVGAKVRAFMEVVEKAFPNKTFAPPA